MKLKDLLKKDNSKKLNEAGLASYYNRAEAPVKSAAKKVDQMLNDLVKDKNQMAKLIDAITDLADEYAQERIDSQNMEEGATTEKKLEEAAEETLMTKPLASVHHTRIIKWMSQNLDGNYDIKKAGSGYEINIDSLSTDEEKLLRTYLKSQSYIK